MLRTSPEGCRNATEVTIGWVAHARPMSTNRRFTKQGQVCNYRLRAFRYSETLRRGRHHRRCPSLRRSPWSAKPRGFFKIFKLAPQSIRARTTVGSPLGVVFTELVSGGAFEECVHIMRRSPLSSMMSNTLYTHTGYENTIKWKHPVYAPHSEAKQSLLDVWLRHARVASPLARSRANHNHHLQ